MAIVTRNYSAVGPSSTAKLVEFVEPSAAIAEQFPTPPIVGVQIDDAVNGAVETLDAYMTQLGFVYVAVPPALNAWALAVAPGAQANRIPLYAKDVAGTLQLFAQVSSGIEYQLTPSLATTGSLAIAAGVPGNFDFNALGTVDWLFPDMWNTSKQTWHGKVRGGWLLESFEWIHPDVGFTATDARAWVMTAANTDDLNINGLAGTRAMPGFNGSGVTRTGFRMRLPCSPTPRVLRFQGTMFNVNTTTTARLSDSSLAAPVSRNDNTGNGSGLDYRQEITFSGPPTVELIVDMILSAIRAPGPNGNLYVGAIGVS